MARFNGPQSPCLPNPVIAWLMAAALAVPSTAVGSEWVVGYLASGESVGKAGGYAIQGLAAEVIERVEGSTSNVVGLPVEVVAEMLSELGIDVD